MNVPILASHEVRVARFDAKTIGIQQDAVPGFLEFENPYDPPNIRFPWLFE
jgi:hypothetical protein